MCLVAEPVMKYHLRAHKYHLFYAKHKKTNLLQALNETFSATAIAWTTKRLNVPFFHLAIHRRRTILICIDRKDKGSQKQNTTQVQNQLSPQRAYSSKNKSPRCYDLIGGLSSFPEKTSILLRSFSCWGKTSSHKTNWTRVDSSMHKSIIQNNKCQLNPHRV